MTRIERQQSHSPELPHLRPLGGVRHSDFSRWPDTAGYPSITGGSTEEDSPEKARELFVQLFTHKWDKNLRSKEFRRVVIEVVRLRKKYPEIYKEVLEKLDQEDEKYQQFLQVVRRTRGK